jgi:hypothetical protein
MWGPQTGINMAKESIGSSFFLSDCGILRDKLLASILYFFYYISMDQRESKSSVGRGLYHERTRGSTYSYLEYTA